MHDELPERAINLFSNCPLRLKNARGLCIACISGTIWITVEGESGDVFLRAGAQYTLESNGLALAEAIGSGRILLLRAPHRMDGMLACGRRFAALERLILGDRI